MGRSKKQLCVVRTVPFSPMPNSVKTKKRTPYKSLISKPTPPSVFNSSEEDEDTNDEVDKKDHSGEDNPSHESNADNSSGDESGDKDACDGMQKNCISISSGDTAKNKVRRNDRDLPSHEGDNNVPGNANVSDVPSKGSEKSAEKVMDGVNLPSIEKQKNERKQRRSDDSDTQVDMRKKVKIQSQPFQELEKLFQRVANVFGNVETSRMNSISEVLDDLHSIPEIVKGSDLHLFATDLFLEREKREVYVSLGETDAKLAWLKYQHRKSNTEK